MAFAVEFSTKYFIRDDQVVSQFERRRNQVYRRFGTIVRREARGLLKKKSGPLKMHSSEPNLRTIFYGIEGDTLIVGPVGFNGKSPTVPELHEHGGAATIRLPDGRKVNARYKPRAFMFPALQAKSDELQVSIQKFGLV